MKIDINTKMITLLGKPLGQSFAARMQNAGYEAAGLNMLYFYTEVDKDHLGDVVNGLRYMNFAGFAVTKPNKVRVLRYLDELDPLCKKMGASNTVVKTPEGKLIGYNTDGVGFYTSLVEEGKINVEESTFFCFGAGGAGRAMCSVLAYHGAKKIYITDFYEPCAESLVMDINENFAPVAELVHHGDYAKIAECNVVMNASGIGMGSTIGQTPMPVEHIQPGQFYFDACYNPDKTQFLLNAEEKGCQVLNGLACPCIRAPHRSNCGLARKPLWKPCARSSWTSWRRASKDPPSALCAVLNEKTRRERGGNHALGYFRIPGGEEIGMRSSPAPRRTCLPPETAR